jgi:hypothetical protein
MSNAARLSVALADVATDFASAVARVTKYSDQLCKLETEGFPVTNNEYRVRYQSDIEVSRNQLAMIRKIVGRLQVTSKCVPCDFDRTSEVIVTVKPMSKDFDALKFTYRSPFRGGGKCHVETQKSESTYRTIVCKV